MAFSGEFFRLKQFSRKEGTVDGSFFSLGSKIVEEIWVNGTVVASVFVILHSSSARAVVFVRTGKIRIGSTMVLNAPMPRAQGT